MKKDIQRALFVYGLALFVVILSACGRCPGRDGQDGTSMGIDVVSADPSVCSAGGSKITVFKDLNGDGTLENSDVVTAITSVCNGVDGRNGQDGTSVSISVQTASATQCPNGGYVFSATGNPAAVVCNGSQGQQGIQGPTGQPGTQVTPVKFCSNDNSSYPEYGLMVGNQLFAVYWGTTPASPHSNQAFLALLTPGSYMSTGGNNCNFTIN